MNRPIALVLVLLAAFAASAQAPEALYTAGRQALIRSEFEKAAELLEKAVKARPTSAESHYWLASAYGNIARRSSNPLKQASLAKKSKTHLERAVELDPKGIDQRLALIDFYLMAPGFMGGSEEKALQQATEVRKIDSLAGHRAFARLYSYQKKSDLARNEMMAAVSAQPNAAKPRYYRGVFLAAEKNYKDAFDDFQAAAALDPTYMPSWFRIGVTAVLLENHYGRGEEALKKYLAYAPTLDEPSHARALYWLGQIYEKQGKKTEARQSYQSSLKLAPGAKDVTEALKRVS